MAKLEENMEAEKVKSRMECWSEGRTKEYQKAREFSMYAVFFIVMTFPVILWEVTSILD